MQSPSLQLYNKIFDICRGYGFLVVDYHDRAKKLSYPFITVQTPDEAVERFTFSSLSGGASVQVKVFSKASDRGAHDQITHTIKMELAKLDRLNDYTIMLNDVQVNVMQYSETGEELLQSNILAEYKTY